MSQDPVSQDPVSQDPAVMIDGTASNDTTSNDTTSTDATPAATESHRLEIPGVQWRRISPKYLVAEFLGLAVTAVVMGLITVPFYFFGWDFAWLLTVAFVGSVLLYAAFTPRRVRAIGYQLREDDLVFRRGILFQRFVAVPYGRMQLVDINRGPLSRALGLSDLKFVTAAAGSGVAIPGLPAQEADDLRDHLVAVAESRRAGL